MKIQKKKIMNITRKSGITLISLVITIIILLILAGISISLLKGSGLLKNVEQAKEKTEEAEEKQNYVLKEYVDSIDEQGFDITEARPVVKFADEFDKYIYIDSNNGNDSTGDGSKEKPYATLYKITTGDIIKNDYSYAIVLQEGTYELIEDIFKLENCNQSINIIGKKEKTILKVNGIFPNSCGGKTTYSVNFYRLIWDGNNYYNNNIIFVRNPMSLNAVVFININTDGWTAYFIPDSTLKLNNCTMPKQVGAMLRTTQGTIELINCYGGFTSGYATNDNNWNNDTDYITSNPQVDLTTYEIIDENLNDEQKVTLGVYNGQYSWKFEDDI